MRERPLRNQAGQTLEEFLAAYHPKDYPHPSVTVDLLIFSLERARPELLMIRRGNHPYLGCWALPGGFVEPEEFTEDAAARELEEETHVRGLTLSEIGLFSGPDRDPGAGPCPAPMPPSPSAANCRSGGMMMPRRPPGSSCSIT